MRIGVIGCLVASLAAAGPTATPAVPGEPPTIVVDTADRVIAAANRRAIEAKLSPTAPVQLPAGTIHLDRALTITGPCTIQGVGPLTVLRNSFTQSPFGDNCTVHSRGTGLGYGDSGTTKIQSARDRIVTAPITWDIDLYAVGRVVFLTREQGWSKPDGLGQLCQRRTIVALRRDAKTLDLTLDGDVDPRCTVITSAAGYAIHETQPGATTVRLVAPLPGNPWPIGATLWIGDGPVLADSFRGEMRTLTDRQGLTLTLDRPLRRAYREAAAVELKPVADVTLRDLTIDQPASQGQPLFAKMTRNWRLERVTVRSPTAAGPSCSSRWTVIDCDFHGAFGAGTSEDLAVVGGHIESLYCEEACIGVSLDRVRIGPTQMNAMSAMLGCSDFRISNCDIIGCRNMPLALECPRSTLTDCTIRESMSKNGCFLAGDEITVRGLRSDQPVIFKGGAGWSVSQVRAPEVHLGWIEGGPSTGVAIDVGKSVKRGRWTVLP